LTEEKTDRDSILFLACRAAMGSPSIRGQMRQGVVREIENGPKEGALDRLSNSCVYDLNAIPDA
jgi:hypothetical protein